jgi:serine/threonine protein kinase
MRDASGIEQVLFDFENAWKSDTPPRLDDFLRAVPEAARQELLEELIVVDLEHRWRNGLLLVADAPPRPGSGPRLEEYLRRYPKLARLSLEMIGAEYRVRQRWGDRPPTDEYLARFAAHGPQVRETLVRVDAELKAEFATIRPASARAPQSNGAARPAPVVPPVSADALIDVLRQYRLLSTAHLQEVRKLQHLGPGPRRLAQELLRRGWLTAYQVNQLLQGRGPDLVLGSYVLLERLGEGGTGQVFKARHQGLDRIVALKVIRAALLTDPEVVGRFYREIQVLSQLSHPNVVRAYDAGPCGNTHMLAMEFVEGIDLARLVKQNGPLPVAQACACIRQAALGLQHAHEHRLVHRDIKPHNLFVSGKGAAGQVKVLDLGLARISRSASGETTAAFTERLGSSLTPVGAVMLGTLDYMAPEQALDFHKADIRADIYSLGCTFYFLLAGRPPFGEGTVTQKLLSHQNRDVPDLSQVRRDVPVHLRTVLQRMMAKSPEHRFQSPAEVIAALDDRSGVPFAVPPSAGSDRAAAAPPATIVPSSGGLRRFGPRTKRWTLKAALLLLLVGCAVATLGWFRIGTGPVTVIENSTHMKLAYIKPGKFQMGSPADGQQAGGGDKLESPRHQVRLTRGFYMGVHEVTQDQYQKVMSQNPSAFPESPDHPVERVRFEDAVEFCKRLSAAAEEKKAGRLYRLPTEAEWEYACRAGAATLFHGGNSLSSRQANFNGTEPFGGAEQGTFVRKTVKVGSYPPNAWGLYDMHGNVAEWCLDGPRVYTAQAVDDPRGPETVGTERVLRGGGWEHSGWWCRCAVRAPSGSTNRYPDRGFRVVCELPRER